MDKKQRRKIHTIAIALIILGFACVTVAGLVQDKINYFYACVFGILGFAFVISALIILIAKYPKLVASEMEDRASALETEDTFFTRVKLKETPFSLKEKFKLAGFHEDDGFHHRKKFSLAKDYINYYAFVVDDTDMGQYIDTFIHKFDDLTGSQKHLNKNNYVFIVFFKNNVSNDDLLPLKNLIITQDVTQDIQRYYLDTVVPVVYDYENQEFILRNKKSTWSIKPINIAMKRFCKIVFKG